MKTPAQARPLVMRRSMLMVLRPDLLRPQGAKEPDFRGHFVKQAHTTSNEARKLNRS